MPLIHDFLSSSEHFRETLYTVKYHLCGKDNCNICKQVGQTVRTPMTEIGELHDKVLQWMDLLIPNPIDKDHFLTPEDTRKYIDKKKPSFNDLIKHLPNMRKDTK
eukprot:7361394-Ditylum_brightwellii.AAC.1